MITAKDDDHDYRPEGKTHPDEFPDMPFYYCIEIRVLSVLAAQIISFAIFFTV